MGYVYEGRHSGRGRLCCDACGNAGGVRKVRCPFGYCQATALCPACRKNPKIKVGMSAEGHRALGCEAAHESFVKREAATKSMLDAGEYVRVAALGQDDGRVKVWFRNRDSVEKVYLMTAAAYGSIPLLVPATPADYGSGLVEVES